MVLGALGCGVFANSPEAVDLDEEAKSWRQKRPLEIPFSEFP